jgi:SecD/SecF fusion protein
LIVLMVWMLAYYRIPGLIANLALLIYCAILLGLIKIALPTALALLLGLGLFVALTYMILANKDSGGEKLVSFMLACVVLFFMTFVLSTQVTLTLAGIAGVILSIGMAVDANILIFERIREELNEGKSLGEAINEGFHRAWDSIRDSNFSSLITCAILFYFGSSIIRGFALNLALGILVSMFSAISLTYTFLQFTAQSKTMQKNLWLFGKTEQKKELNIPFIGLTKVWAGISAVLITASFLAVGIFGLNLGLDFTGGTLLEVKVGDENLTPQTIELGGDYGTPHIVKTDQGSFIMRMRTLSEEEHQTLLSSLEASYGEVEEIRFTTVGPSIGDSLKNKAILALSITLVMIVLYIAFAFRRVPKEVSPWRFGMSAIAALIHDIIILIGSFVVLGHFFGFEIDALFITALLTIMGFSVHDTIVVFDRMRENLRFREANEGLAVTADRALNQTLARSVNTSLSALIMILALVFFGAESLKPFVVALTIGIVVGTYSSIFIASPLLVWWNEKAQAKR